MTIESGIPRPPRNGAGRFDAELKSMKDDDSMTVPEENLKTVRSAACRLRISIQCRFEGVDEYDQRRWRVWRVGMIKRKLRRANRKNRFRTYIKKHPKWFKNTGLVPAV